MQNAEGRRSRRGPPAASEWSQIPGLLRTGAAVSHKTASPSFFVTMQVAEAAANARLCIGAAVMNYRCIIQHSDTLQIKGIHACLCKVSSSLLCKNARFKFLHRDAQAPNSFCRGAALQHCKYRLTVIQSGQTSSTGCSLLNVP